VGLNKSSPTYKVLGSEIASTCFEGLAMTSKKWVDGGEGGALWKKHLTHQRRSDE
jgi:hypothetical protein